MTTAELRRVAPRSQAKAATRYRIQFPTLAAMESAMALETTSQPAVINRKRRSMSVEALPRLGGGELLTRGATQTAGAPSDAIQTLADAFNGKVVEDYQYQLEDLDFFDPDAFQPEVLGAQSLEDMTRLIRANEVWPRTRGANVIVAVVDTGITGTRPEFPPERRSARSWAPIGEDPWTDWQGHGTMCASIAVGSMAGGGAFDGVAPEATIMSCRTHFYDSELAAIYDVLADLAREGHTVVATNSFGTKTGTPPPAPEDSEFIDALDEAIAAGVYVHFSAGNYHQLAGGKPQGDAPNSIWLHKSRADVMTVAACQPDNGMWFYSSRGPGQFFGSANTNEKPDVAAPTPPNGRVVYGAQVLSLPEGWGTSGCCPQVAGLSALLLSAFPGTPRERLFDVIRNAAQPMGNARRAEGHGLIDCMAALQALP